MLLPTFMRSATIVELFKILSLPFTATQDKFYANREKNLYKIKHNGQVCHVRAVLNDAFNLTLADKHFLIEDAEDTGVWQYAFREVNEHRYDIILIDKTEPTFIYSEETMTKFADFVVKIPTELNNTDNLNVIKSLVNTYKLISKKAIYEYY